MTVQVVLFIHAAILKKGTSWYLTEVDLHALITSTHIAQHLDPDRTTMIMTAHVGASVT